LLKTYLTTTVIFTGPVEAWLAALESALATRPVPLMAPVTLVLGDDQPAEPELAKAVIGLHRLGLRVLAIEGRSAVSSVSLVQPTSDSRPAPLVLSGSVRSGQAVVHPTGDVIVEGSLGSGAEIAAGGSVHIYGALRGRVMAGLSGDAQALVACGAFHAEHLTIGGLAAAPDDLEAVESGRPVLIRRAGGRLVPVAA
jgi:septum site-determining protein MinC